MSMDVDEAKEMIAEIDRMIEEDLSEKARDKGSDFFEDVQEQMADVEETIVENGYVTDNQERALRNWKTGVGKWIHDD